MPPLPLKNGWLFFCKLHKPKTRQLRRLGDNIGGFESRRFFRLKHRWCGWKRLGGMMHPGKLTWFTWKWRLLKLGTSSSQVLTFSFWCYFLGVQKPQMLRMYLAILLVPSFGMVSFYPTRIQRLQTWPPRIGDQISSRFESLFSMNASLIAAVHARYSKHPLKNGCVNWMIPDHHMNQTWVLHCFTISIQENPCFEVPGVSVYSIHSAHLWYWCADNSFRKWMKPEKIMKIWTAWMIIPRRSGW